MAILKSALLVAAIGSVFVAAQKPENEIAADSVTGQALSRGSADIQIQVEEAVVGNFAGFFDVSLRRTRIEDGTVVHADVERGTIALTFNEFTGQPVPTDLPTGFNGMFLLGRDKYPWPISLTARLRRRGNSFNVSLSGLADSEFVGVATVNRDAITIRLFDDGPLTTVLTLRRQSAAADHTAPKSVQSHLSHGNY